MGITVRLLCAAALAASLPAQGQSLTVLPIGFSSPAGIARDAAGNLFVADTGGNAIKEIPASGGYPQGVAIALANGNFNGPRGVALDAAGNLFVADTGNNAIKEILAEGGYTTV